MITIRLWKDDSKGLPDCPIWGSELPKEAAAKRFEEKRGYAPKYCYLLGKTAYFPVDRDYVPDGAE